MVRCALLWLLLLWAATAQAELRASVDRRVVDENDVVVLELARDAQVFVGNPDLTALEKDFNVLGTQRSSQFTIVNGRTRSLTTWTVTLQPKRRGQLRIPSIEYDGERTTPITVTVTQPSPAEVAALERTVFFETQASKPSLWVQEQVLYTVRLYYAADAVLFGDLPPAPRVTDAVVQAIGDSRPSVEVREGVRYNVIEQRYAVIPQRSGTLVIPPETFSGAVRIAERGRTRRKNLRITSDGHRIEVRAQPDAWPADAPWLPARDLMLNQRWDPTPLRLRAGEPVTRSLEIVARGVAASALPDLPELEINGASTYANQPVLDEGMATGDFIASRIESTVLIPEAEGPLNLPELRVPWFDVERGEIRMAVIPAQRMQVAPGDALQTPAASDMPAAATDAASESTSPPIAFEPGPEPVPKRESPDEGSDLWSFGGGLLAFAIAIFIGILLGRRQRSDGTGTDSNRRTTAPQSPAAGLLAACEANDAIAARRLLPTWLSSLQTAPDEQALSSVRAELDAAVFGTAPLDWNGRALGALVKVHRGRPRRRAGKRTEVPLPALHPEITG